MADDYETAHGLSVGTDDRYGDLDGDGYPNLLEAVQNSDANDVGSVPTADAVVGAGQTYTTIGGALSAMSGEDKLVIVKPGTYNETVDNAKSTDSQNRRLYIIAESTDPYQTVISSTGSGVLSKRDLYLRGFSIVHSGAVGNDGVSLSLSATTSVPAPRASVEQCVIRNFNTGLRMVGDSSRTINTDVVNCLIQQGSLGFYSQYTNVRPNHCTVCDNTSYGFQVVSPSTVSVKNSILRNTGASETSGTVSFTYSNVRGASPPSGTGNQNSDPLLAQGFLRSGSPCIDAGQTGSPPLSDDCRGEARQEGSGVDIGCHEYRTTGLITSDVDGDSVTDEDELYTHTTKIYSTDTDGDRMDDGYEVTHTLNPLSDDRFGDLDGDRFPNVLEFLRATSASNAASVPSADATVGAGQTYTTISSALSALSGEDKLVIVKPGTYTETVDNAKSTASQNRSLYIIAESTDPYVTVISTGGNGVLSYRELYLRGFSIVRSGAVGGSGVQFSTNGTTPRGAIEQCVIRNFSSSIQVTGTSSFKLPCDLTNCLIQEQQYGISAAYGAFRLNHCTICDSTLAGISANSSTVTATNSILRNTGNEIQGSSTTWAFTYSSVRGGISGTGNQSSDPLLAQGFLRSGSPCIDAGQASTPALAFDFRGEARPAGSVVDIGCHEYRTTGLIAGDTDSDGVSDGDELYTSGTRLFLADTDGDRMNDGYEVTHSLKPLTDDRFEDADGDRFPNILEALKGTAASNASSVPSADATVGAGQTYTTISAALSALTGEDKLVIVKPGTYSETVDNAKSTASLNRSLYVIAEDSDPYRTVINATTGVMSYRDIYVRGFAISKSGASGSYGVSITSNGTLPRVAIDQCVIRNFGSGLSLTGASTSSKINVDVWNCLIQENGTAFNPTYTNLRVNHSTICDNSGFGMYVNYSTVTMSNSIQRNPSGTELQAYSTTFTFTYSNVRGGVSGTGNQSSDPLLAQGYLRAGSPCIDAALAGSPALASDIRGESRPTGSGVDMGCHEYRTTGLIAQDFDGDGVTDSDELYTLGTKIFLADTDGDRMTDGYEASNGLSPLTDDRYGDADGDRIPNVLEALRGTAANSASSVPSADATVGAGQTYTTISAALSALTGEDKLVIVKPGSYPETVDNAKSNPTLNRSLFIVAEAADPRVTSITPSGTGVQTNRDLYLRGFNLLRTGSSGTAYGCSITSNARAWIEQCIMRNFSNGVDATGPSSGVKATAELTNCLISEGGAGVSSYYGIVKLNHCTICDNVSYGLSMYASTATVRNSILRNLGSQEISASSTTQVYSYSNVRGGVSGTGNQSSDPLHVQGFLRSTSPCVDAGQSGGPTIAADLLGETRPEGAGIDMGCHEYRSAGLLNSDFDGDGLTDRAELYTWGSRFYLTDTDADRMDDYFESTHGLKITVDDRLEDPDGDRFPNLIEFLNGGAPDNAASKPTADATVGVGGTHATISAALNSLSGEDKLVVVKPGIYSETVDNHKSTPSQNRNLYLISEAVDPRQTSIFPPGGNGVQTNRDFYLRGFTLTNVGPVGGIGLSLALSSSGSVAAPKVWMEQCIVRRFSVGIKSLGENLRRPYAEAVNCLIQDGGDGMWGYYGTVKANHCTICGNSGYAANMTYYATANIQNSILRNLGAAEYYTYTSTINTSYSNVRGGASGTANQSSDPLLQHGLIFANSPALNAAQSSPPASVCDLRGLTRPSGSAPDMGCYEVDLSRPANGEAYFEFLMGLSSDDPAGDADGDGLNNAAELAAGTDIHRADSDGDGVSDGTDAFPMDPAASSYSGSTPDTTPPTIGVTKPSGASKL